MSMLARRDLVAAAGLAAAGPARPPLQNIWSSGAFSISLTVKDLEASRQFYEKFGFSTFAGAASENYLIRKNGDHLIGLFHGMFENKILTFNAGWDTDARKLAAFTDVREMQRQLKAQVCTF